MQPGHEAAGGLAGFEYQGSYIYKPAKKSNDTNGTSNKRRKVNHASSSRSSGSRISPFVPLLNGYETKESVKLRYDLFQDLWAQREHTIQSILREVDSEVLKNIAAFIEESSTVTYNGRIPTGMISVGSNISSTGGLLERLRKELQSSGNACLVTLDSGDTSNIKNALKTIIKLAITSIDGIDSYRDYLTSKTGLKLLPYDLDLMLACVRRNGVKKVVIAFKDSEAFDSSVLSDLITLLSSWLDRIPFVFLFGIATSVTYLESRLPRSTVKLLEGRLFDFQDFGDSVDRIFAALFAQNNEGPWIGHSVSHTLMDRSGDCFQSPERFGNIIKYAYMAHFFANSLSVLLAGEMQGGKLQPELCEAIRNTPSFRKHVQHLLDTKDSESAKEMMEDDIILSKQAYLGISVSRQKMRDIFSCVEWLVAFTRNMKSQKSANHSECIILALGGELLESKFMVETLEAARKLNSEELDVAFGLISNLSTESTAILDEIRELIRTKKSKGALRSQYDAQLTRHNTTVIGQRVKLTKGKAKLSNEELKYSELVDRLCDSIQNYLAEKLVNPKDLFLHECLIFDFKSPIRNTFTPKCRHTVERALSHPFDYLDSKEDEEIEALSAGQPPISILYQLYLESGAVVNVYDLWRAFYAILGGEDGEKCEERVAFSIFYQSLAELKMMGMARISRKKTDHLAKSAWTGL
ncbi:Origin recognition complex subunit [Trichophyton interdigitale]|uniref:Origin recognition complex subunit n=1 Tax=Trichophyton interdigitale TaxID=101480 RepID=A0A9P5D0M7_9EURO|nr:Origin recognition complex subunit [Trichophyton interdigitale]KAG5208410.1 Origin recognition complex subunit [Trichophyton interdigitale]KAG8210295.1 Origin recognition complex subunit [Trichophyton interdigitale]